jgi:hypothetical protein
LEKGVGQRVGVCRRRCGPPLQESDAGSFLCLLRVGERNNYQVHDCHYPNKNLSDHAFSPLAVLPEARGRDLLHRIILSSRTIP